MYVQDHGTHLRKPGGLDFFKKPDAPTGDLHQLAVSTDPITVLNLGLPHDRHDTAIAFHKIITGPQQHAITNDTGAAGNQTQCQND